MQLSKTQLEEFEQHGFLLLKGALDPSTDLQPTEQELSDVFDHYAHILMNKWAPALMEGFTKKPFIERFVILLGLTEGELFSHLEPQAQIRYQNLSKIPDLPDLFLPKLFELSQNNKILDIIENFFGAEITASPHTHINFKPAKIHHSIGENISQKYKTGKFTSKFADINYGKTRWHTDKQTRNADARANRMIVAWVPLTEAYKDNSCLLVVPGSHKESRKKIENDYPNAQAIECSKGDLVIFDSGLIHASTTNISKLEYRLAINFRYVKKGTLSGHYSTPEYVVRSKSTPDKELKNAHLYFHYFNSAVNFFHQYPETKVHSKNMQEAKKISLSWQERIHCYNDWLNIEPDKLNLVDQIKKKIKSIKPLKKLFTFG
ncbi:MAG: hypothetical protein GQ582_06915 [Methyloprofundus sp.]|nr:hypothetical protein [Methyloprofundus sp.]